MADLDLISERFGILMGLRLLVMAFAVVREVEVKEKESMKELRWIFSGVLVRALSFLQPTSFQVFSDQAALVLLLA